MALLVGVVYIKKPLLIRQLFVLKSIPYRYGKLKMRFVKTEQIKPSTAKTQSNNRSEGLCIDFN